MRNEDGRIVINANAALSRDFPNGAGVWGFKMCRKRSSLGLHHRRAGRCRVCRARPVMACWFMGRSQSPIRHRVWDRCSRGRR